MARIEIVWEDYLPDGITFDDINKAFDKKEALPLTKENLAKVVDPKYFDMTEEDLIKYLVEGIYNFETKKHN